MDSYITGNDDQFMHGDVFKIAESDAAASESRKFARSRARKVNRPMTKFKVHLKNVLMASAFALTISTSHFISNVGVSSTNIYQIWNYEEIGIRLREAREYVGLSREKAGEILFVSPEAIKTVEHSSIKAPSHLNMMAYNKFADLVDIYKGFFKEDQKAAKAFFKLPGHAFGDASPFEYIKNRGPEAISDVMAIHRRMLA